MELSLELLHLALADELFSSETFLRFVNGNTASANGQTLVL